VFSSESPKFYQEQGKRSTTISLRESKTTSEWWKKNTALFSIGEDIVCANRKVLEVCQ